MSKLASRKLALLGAVVLAGGMMAPAWADLGIDNITKLVAKVDVTDGGAIQAFTYDPAIDGFYSMGTATGGGSFMQLTSYANPDGSIKTPTKTSLLSNSQWAYWLRNGGVATYTGGSYQIGGVLLNPLPITMPDNSVIPAGSRAYIMDGGTVVKETVAAVTTNHNEITQRFYNFDVAKAHTTPVNPTALDGATGYMNSLVTHAAILTTLGDPNPNTSTVAAQVGRQYAWSSDGQRVYADVIGTGTAGLWQFSAVDGSVKKIFLDSGMTQSEPTVIAGVDGDHIYVGGTVNSGNANGLDYYVWNDGNTSLNPATDAHHVLTAAQLQAFLETSTAPVFNSTILQDANGNLIIEDQGDKVTLMLDSQGRLSKVSSGKEKIQSDGNSLTSNIKKLQNFKTITYTPASGAPYSVQQIAYEDQGTIGSISAITLFKNGDFNRDNLLNSDDVTLFKAVLGVRGSLVSTNANYKFDLNGNGGVDWKDVKVLQTFYPFANGDADINGVVDQSDLNTFRGNWGLGSTKWTDGKFDGGTSITDAKAKVVGAADLTLISANWGSTGFGTASNTSIGRFVADLTSSATPAINLTTGDTAVLAAKSASTGGTKVIITTTVAIDNASKLDLKDNDLISRGSTPADIRALLLAGYGGTVGLTTTTTEGLAHASGLGYLLGSDYKVINGATLDGIAVGDTDTVVKYTVMGDVDLDGTITGVDFAQLDAAYLSGLYTTGTNARWINGDFNYDGVISTADFGLIDAAFLILHPNSELALARIAADTARFGAEYTTQLEAVLTAVPEPSSLALLGLAGLWTLRSRRK